MKTANRINKPQPKPQGKGKVVINYVISDLLERAEVGKKKYGTYLETGNSRDALIDAYQEAMDLVMYLRQLILEREDYAGLYSLHSIGENKTCDTV